MSLTKYWQKRDFAKTREPKGRSRLKTKSSLFVIQKHESSKLHYDFRLEVAGVLKSWALPKGMPEKVNEKRLAVETEDHPTEYADFEGAIPKGEYGAGKVKIWDKGTFQNITTIDGQLVSTQKALKKGHLNFLLEGNKIKGSFTFIAFKKINKGHNQWLLIKRNDT